jgi:glycerol uptake facilitator-like aquaporin
MSNGIGAKALAEFVGTGLLVCVVVGSGIMGDALSTDDGVALFINTVSTVFALALLIVVIGPISGAHLNPAVTLVNLLSRQNTVHESTLYVAAQTAGAIGGAILANVMFDLSALQLSERDRTSPGMLVGEVVATAGLIAVIGILTTRKQNAIIPVAVAAWIGSACFFTSSTSFANPAVTVGRMFTDAFAGIAPTSVLPYIAAQLVGAFIGMAIVTAVKRS